MVDNKYKVIIKDNSIRIYINSLPFLVIKQDEFIGYQSWLNGDNTKTYWIEFYCNSRSILTGYDSFDKWKAILTELDTKDLFLNDLTKNNT